MDLKKQYNNLIRSSIVAGGFIIIDENIDSLLYRVCVVLISSLALYRWVSYFKSYIDFKIDSSKTFNAIE